MTERIKTLTTPHQLTVRTGAGLPSIDLTTDDVDAMNDRVIQAGLTFRNPLPILFAHDYHGLPVGQATTDTIARGLHRTRISWRWLENDPRAAAVRNAFEQGMLGASIGMKVHETTPNEHGGVDIVRAEGIEGSLTATPANPACVRLLKDLGWGRGQRGVTSCPAGTDCPNDMQAERCPAGNLCPMTGSAHTSWRAGEPRIVLLDDGPGDFLILDLDATRSVPSNVSTAKAPKGTAWNAPSLGNFTRKPWSALSDAEKRHIAGHFAWADEMPPATYGSLKLPHHRPSDGAAVFRGVAAAAARLDQTDGIDAGAVKAHLRAHYEAFGEDIPDSLKFSGDDQVTIDPHDLVGAFRLVIEQEARRTYNKLRGRIDDGD